MINSQETLRAMVATSYKRISSRDPDPEAALHDLQTGVMILLSFMHTQLGGTPKQLSQDEET
jgi:hypothetical protein